MIKAGDVRDDKGQLYFFALGRSSRSNERTVDDFTRSYFLLLPVMIFVDRPAGLGRWRAARSGR